MDDIFTDLHVFVHLVDSQEHIVSQCDQIPVEWTRPTAGWMPGEVIADGCILTMRNGLPPGDYQVRMGWYDPIDGKRVPVLKGDSWVLPQPVIVERG
jgi:hypothetical protein